MADKPFKIVYQRAGCIECGACVKLVPDFWTLNETDDMKADLIGGKKTISKNGTVLKEELDVDGLDPHWIAYECCPIKVIKLFDNKTGKLVKLRSEFNVNETHHDNRNDTPFKGKEIK